MAEQMRATCLTEIDSSVTHVVATDVGTEKSRLSFRVQFNYIKIGDTIHHHDSCPLELTVQIAKQFEALGSEIGVKCAMLVGGIDMVQQSIKIAKQPHLIVLDEVDRLLNEDFEESLNEILQLIPCDRRTFLFSATMTKKLFVLLKVFIEPFQTQLAYWGRCSR
ncbi:hypothetical protein Fmac_021786 [Flemingia macrophylla]|uniref:Helicase ATP-binding domain-containing protein n=1 Tax=Flemingia macrophylla TaxID=520843 RepID=A0ABD1LXZ7_9FABA